MATNKYIREKLLPDMMIFNNHSCDNAIIGTTFDGRAIYSLELMINELIVDENWTKQEAINWIEINILKSIPYFKANAPIIVHMTC